MKTTKDLIESIHIRIHKAANYLNALEDFSYSDKQAVSVCEKMAAPLREALSAVEEINKANRKRGRIVEIIRDLARRRKHFSTDSLLPAMSWKQAKDNLNWMVRKGELVRVLKYRGFGSEKAIYKKAK